MTAIMINPGSHIGEPGEGWTNTLENARAEAERWLSQMRDDGICDVELLDLAIENEGRWTFSFRHTVTGVVVELATHGIDNVEAYEKQHTFTPRIYWNGSSTSNPELEHFAAPGFEAVKTFTEGEQQ